MNHISKIVSVLAVVQSLSSLANAEGNGSCVAQDTVRGGATISASANECPKICSDFLVSAKPEAKVYDCRYIIGGKESLVLKGRDPLRNFEQETAATCRYFKSFAKSQSAVLKTFENIIKDEEARQVGLRSSLPEAAQVYFSRREQIINLNKDLSALRLYRYKLAREWVDLLVVHDDSGRSAQIMRDINSLTSRDAIYEANRKKLSENLTHTFRQLDAQTKDLVKADSVIQQRIDHANAKKLALETEINNITNNRLKACNSSK